MLYASITPYSMEHLERGIGRLSSERLLKIRLLNVWLQMVGLIWRLDLEKHQYLGVFIEVEEITNNARCNIMEAFES